VINKIIHPPPPNNQLGKLNLTHITVTRTSFPSIWKERKKKDISMQKPIKIGIHFPSTERTISITNHSLGRAWCVAPDTRSRPIQSNGGCGSNPSSTTGENGWLIWLFFLAGILGVHAFSATAPKEHPSGRYVRWWGGGAGQGHRAGHRCVRLESVFVLHRTRRAFWFHTIPWLKARA